MRDDPNIIQILTGLLSPLRKANWKIVFLSLSAATVFWFFNALNKTYTTRLSYPVVFEFGRDSLTEVRGLPANLPLNVTALGWNLLKRTLIASANPILIPVENPTQSRYMTARNLLPVISEQLEGITVNYLALDTVFLQIEPISERTLRIAVDSVGVPLQENCVIVSKIHIEPDIVRFRGPASLIEAMPFEISITLPEQAIARDYRRELSLDLFVPPRIRKFPDVIQVSFEVDRFIDQLALVPIVPVNYDENRPWELERKTVTANFQLLNRRQGKFSLYEIAIIADFNNLDKADSTITLEVIQTPSYVRNVVLQEEKVKLVNER